MDVLARLTYRIAALTLIAWGLLHVVNHIEPHTVNATLGAALGWGLVGLLGWELSDDL